MRDIFISYASGDRPTAHRLAESLRSEGWSVWWDRIIPPGKSFPEVIEREIADARCVVVLWSKASIKSQWVMREARVGAERRVLIPAVIDSAKPPFEFNEIQAAWLVDWRGDRSHQGFCALLTALSDLLGAPAMNRTDNSGQHQRPLTPRAKSEQSRYPRSRLGDPTAPPSEESFRHSVPKQEPALEKRATGPSHFLVGLDSSKPKWKVVVATGCATLLVLVVGGKLLTEESEPSAPDIEAPTSTQSSKVPVRIESYGETYDLYRNNVPIGKTPHEFKELLGTKVVIECRRGGQNVDVLEFEVGVRNIWSCKN